MYLFSRRIAEITLENDLMITAVFNCILNRNPSKFASFILINLETMVGVAQLVRAPGCGPGGRRFKSGHSPQIKISECSAVRLAHLLWEQGVGSSNLSTPTPFVSDEKPRFTSGLSRYNT